MKGFGSALSHLAVLTASPSPINFILLSFCLMSGNYFPTRIRTMTVYTYICVCVCIYMYVCMYIYVCMYVCMYILCVCVCVCVCVCCLSLISDQVSQNL